MYLMDNLKKHVDKQNDNEHGQNVDVTEIDGVDDSPFEACTQLQFYVVALSQTKPLMLEQVMESSSNWHIFYGSNSLGV